MDPENEDLKKGQKQDSKDIGNILKSGKDLFKKKTNQFVMLLRKIPAFIAALPLIFQLIIVLVVTVVITTFISTVLSIFGDNDTANAAAMTVIKNEVTLTKADDDNGYYFKINQNVLDVYIEETYKADQKDNKDIFPDDDDDENNEETPEEPDENEEEEEQEKNEYDEEEEEKTKQSIEDWFKVKDFKEYFVKMIRAEIASTYPKLGNYIGKEGSEDNQGNKKDNDGDYVAQGIVQIHRQKMNEDGTVEAEQELTYLPRESEDPNEKTLKGLIAANDPEALNHFSFDEKTGLIYYVTYRRVVVTVDGVEDPERSSYTLNEQSASYKTLTAMCSMPYDFLFALLQTSENPEYIMAVADLLLDKSTVILMIQDQLNISEFTEINRQVEKTEKTQLTGHEETYRYGNTVQTSTYWSHGETVATYSFPAGDTETVVSTTYENTANIYIKKAETWCMDFEQEAIQNEPIETRGEPVEVTHDESEYAGLTYPDTPVESNRDSIPSPYSGATFTIIEKFLSLEKLTHTTQLYSKSYTWRVTALTEKRINYERFVGLWKNDRGEYYEGCLFDENNPNQKDVSYPVPGDERKLDVVVDNIADYQGQTINDLIELLSLHENTQTHEQLMKYFWNKYYGEDIYEVNLDELLNLFDTSVFVPISGRGSGTSLLKEYIRHWENAGGAPMSADGTKYIIHDDGAGNPTVGYGIDINNGGFKNLFIQGGYPTEIGGEVDKEFVDGLEDMAIENCLNEIRSRTSGLDLKEYQIHALVSRAYNCGVQGAVGVTRGTPALNFVDSYSKYWNEETDNLYEKGATTGDYTHSLYTQYMSKPVTSKRTIYAWA